MERFKAESLPNKKEMYLTPPGFGGHKYDYTLNLEGYGINSDFIPESVASLLSEELGDDWRVDNRGTRLEISNTKEHSKRNDDYVSSVVQRVFKEYKLK